MCDTTKRCVVRCRYCCPPLEYQCLIFHVFNSIKTINNIHTYLIFFSSSLISFSLRSYSKMMCVKCANHIHARTHRLKVLFHLHSNIHAAHSLTMTQNRLHVTCTRFYSHRLKRCFDSIRNARLEIANNHHVKHRRWYVLRTNFIHLTFFHSFRIIYHTNKI